MKEKEEEKKNLCSMLLCRPCRVAKVESGFCVAQFEVNVSRSRYKLHRQYVCVSVVMRTRIVGTLVTVTGCTG
ncbi:unnamed protein product [Victoria cruziana]